MHYIEEEWTLEKCDEKFLSAEEENKKIMKDTTLAVGGKRITEKGMVSLLNSCRSVYIASQSMKDASKTISLHFPLEE